MSERVPPDQHFPQEFAPVLAGIERPLVVGGQAVNIWAELYQPRIPELKQYAPYTSRDADIFGTRALAETLARRSGWEFKAVTARDSIAVATLTKRVPAGGPSLLVEVLKEVNGLNEADLGKSSVVQMAPGRRCRIPAPPVLLKAKLYNLASLVGVDRPQDLKHARMLLHVVPENLNEMLAEHRAGRLAAENLIGAIGYLKEVVHSGASQNAARAFQLDLRKVVPPSVGLASGEIGRAAAQLLEGLPASAVGEAPPSAPRFRI